MNEELKIIISAQIDELQKNLKKAREEVENTTKKSKVSFEEFSGAMTKAGDVGKKALTITAGAIAAAGAALLGLSAATEDYRKNQAKLNSAFETAGASADTAKQVYNDLYRVLGEDDTAVEAANHLAMMTTNQEELAQWTNVCQGVYATFGASLPIESLTEAANETAKVGTLTGALADALNWAGVNEEDFQAKLDACNTEAEREALIRNTLNGIYSNAAASYEENAKEVLAQNEAQAGLNETMAKLGETMQPVLTALAEMANTIMQQVAPAVQEFMDEHGEELTDTLLEIADAIGKVLGWIIDHWDVVAPVAATILAIAAALSVFSAVMTVVNIVMAASPITWIVLAIVAAIAALVAIVVVCIKYWDEIKAAASKAVDGLKNAWNAVAGWFDRTVVQPIKKAVDKIKQFFSFEWKLPKIKTPKVSITWSTEGTLAKAAQFIGLKGLPKFSVAWNALGGVFDRPTLFAYGGSLQGLGEAGAEAVVPLERNLGWLDKLAQMLNERQGSRPVVLMVDGKVLAQTTVDGINDITRQTGAVPIKIM